jgi:hypothetical protein
MAFMDASWASPEPRIPNPEPMHTE